jgi:hypothetical protein
VTTGQVEVLLYPLYHEAAHGGQRAGIELRR